MIKNKICLVTGATAGIGEVTALKLAGMGATVVGVGRNPAKCEATANHIRKETSNPSVEFLIADLSSQAQTRALADTFCQKYDRLDVLVNNAGAFYFNRALSSDGIEMTFALNHLGYFLLTGLLLDLLKESAPARIVSVSSSAHYNGHLDLDDLEMKNNYQGWQAYANSKLANVLFTYELARRLEGTGGRPAPRYGAGVHPGVTATVLHPGWVATGFGHNNLRGLLAIVRPFYQLVQKFSAITPEEGAETMVYLASSPKVEGVTGKFFVERREKRSSSASYNVEAAKKLWEMSEKMVKTSEV